MKTYGPLPFKLFLSALFRRANCPECGISHTQCLRLETAERWGWFFGAMMLSLLPLGVSVHDLVSIPGLVAHIVFALCVFASMFLTGIVTLVCYAGIDCNAGE